MGWSKFWSLGPTWSIYPLSYYLISLWWNYVSSNWSDNFLWYLVDDWTSSWILYPSPFSQSTHSITIPSSRWFYIRCLFGFNQSHYRKNCSGRPPHPSWRKKHVCFQRIVSRVEIICLFDHREQSRNDNWRTWRSSQTIRISAQWWLHLSTTTVGGHDGTTWRLHQLWGRCGCSYGEGRSEQNGGGKSNGGRGRGRSGRGHQPKC